MGMFNDNSSKTPIPGGSLAKPVLIALGALLVGKLLSGKNDEPEQADPSQPQLPQETASGGSAGGGLGDLLGGSLGGILGGLGGLLGGTAAGNASSAPGGLSGGLGGLLEQLTKSGHGNTVETWVGQGENASIEPDQLGSAIGQKTLSEIAQHAGINEQDLLNQLSQVLPGIVDKLTINGQVPDANQIAQLLKK